jgi:hypothetical protein
MKIWSRHPESQSYRHVTSLEPNAHSSHCSLAIYRRFLAPLGVGTPTDAVVCSPPSPLPFPFLVLRFVYFTKPEDY